MRRLPPVHMLREEIDRQFSEGTDGGQLTLHAFAKAAARLMLQVGLEAKEGMRVYGILKSGKVVLLHLAQGHRESYDAWLSMLHDMTARGLRAPLMVIMDGNPGLREAVRGVFPGVAVQRCQVHKLENVAEHLPGHKQSWVRAGDAAGLADGRRGRSAQ